jgi:8-oxo-dGTP pyrophosphatase MutT (NUDIX family)
MKETTLCLLVKGHPISQVLLGYKKRGFGQGKYTGFGGKIENDESVEHAAIREMYEETGVKISPTDLQRIGQLTFLFPAKPTWDQVVYVFQARDWSGDPQESDEMIPSWFELDQIPYAGMWQDGSFWLPPLLAGQRVQARFVFEDDNESLRQIEIVDLE